MKPLAGRRILITRARRQAGSLQNSLQELGAEVIAAPAIEIAPPDSYAPLDDALLNASRYDWLIVTSANAVAAMSDRMQALDLSSSALTHLQIAAIGPATARTLEKLGWMASVLPQEYIAEAIVDLLRDRVAKKRVLLIRAKVARDIIPEELTRLGAHVHVVEAYQTVMPQEAGGRIQSIFADTAKLPDVIAFTSSSTAKNFFLLLRDAGFASLPANIAVASIGPITSQTLRELGVATHIHAENHTIPGLVDAIAKYYAARA